MLIILDRDGVINQDSPYHIKTPEEWTPVPGSIEAIAALKSAGHQVAIATNQSGVSKGLYSLELMNAIHEKMKKLLLDLDTELDYLAICTHHPNDLCKCRKPEPGMLFEISKALNTPLEGAWFIGDSYRDLQAAWACGANAGLVQTGNGFRTLNEHPELAQSTRVWPDLAGFTRDVNTL